MARVSYKPKKIISIEREDFRISIIGKVIEIGEDYFILEDETGSIKIYNKPENLEKSSLIRVFCTKIDENIFCDFFQKLEGFDLKLFNKVEDLYLKFL
ncbi:MAG: hypothetical protein QXD89_01905 [Candidatus Aenigmatarchaeota archaeon]